MTILLPILAVVLAALAVFLTRGNPIPPDEENEQGPSAWNFYALGLIVVAGLIVAAKFGPGDDQVAIRFGAVAGALAVLIAAIIPRRNAMGSAVLSLGAVAPASLFWLSDTAQTPGRLAVIAGAGLAVLAFSNSPAAARTALVTTLISFVSILGKYNSSVPSLTQGGIVLALGTSLVGLVSLLLQKAGPGSIQASLDKLFPVAVAVVLAGMGYVVGTTYLSLHDVAVCTLLGIGSALVVHYVNPPDQPTEPFRLSVSAIIWIGLATITFTLARGFGMSVALALAGSYLVLMGNSRALLTLGPLVGLVGYRVFRQLNPGMSKLLDIGQHNAMIGLVIGATLPLLPAEWLLSQKTQKTFKVGLGSMVWAAVLGCAVVLVSLMLGSKGTIAFVTGLGFSSFFAGTKRVFSGESALGIALGTLGMTLISSAWFVPILDSSRDDKVKVFGWIAGALVVLAIIVFSLGLAPKGSNDETLAEGGLA